ncbi:MAG: NAD-dependent protein deacylase [Peptococcaceae bacterium]|nr:NAD-dependent protein deacylase [Peptococcaceae bacterium]
MKSSKPQEAPEATLKELLKASDNIVFFGGAGVSTESGIPDFRSEKGIFATRQAYGYPPEVILSRSFFLSKPEIFFKYYRSNLIFESVHPNAAHKALARLEEMGKLKAVITQNIDGLHQAAGSQNVLELHGSVTRNYCIKCRATYDLSSVTNSAGIPECSQCGGMVRPDVVLYEEGLDNHILSDSVGFISAADVLIVGGTSLNVYPAAGLIQHYPGNKLVLINKGSTSYDTRANILIRDSIGKVLGEAVDTP